MRADGIERALVQAQVTARRLLVPGRERDLEPDGDPGGDPARPPRGDRRRADDLAPGSVHFVGAAVQKATGARWLADLRDPLVANQHRRADTTATRARQAANERLARLVAGERRRGLLRLGRDRRRGSRPRCARDRPHDRERVRLRRLRRPRVPAGRTLPDHAYGQLLREARPAAVPAGAARLGARRGRALRRRFPLDRPRVGRRALGLGDRLDLVDYAPRTESLRLQRDSEALLLLVPDAGGRGKASSPGRCSSTSRLAARSSRWCRRTGRPRS